MPTLIKNARIFAPQDLGRGEVLVAGNRIALVAESVDLSGPELRVIDADGRWLLPGLIDPLTHPCGGGGEGGFGNRTAEIDANAFIRAGVTTPVGALGTDSITRTLDSLYGQVMTLRAHGLSALMFSGSYRVPPATLTGDVARDMMLIQPVIGIGEVAIADHRSSHPSFEEFRRLSSDVHLGGTLSGKGGTLLIHVGDGEDGLGLIEEILSASLLPRRLFYPTHVNRQTALLKQAVKHTRRGGFADITVSTTPELIDEGEVPAPDAYRQAVEAGADSKRLTLSSDAGGSLPHYRNGRLAGLTSAPADSLLSLLRTCLLQDREFAQELIAAMTLNTARALKLPHKGRIAAGADADLLLLDAGRGRLDTVMSRGRLLMHNGQIQTMNHSDNTGAY